HLDMTREQKLAASIVITLLVTGLSLWLMSQSPLSPVGTFVTKHDDILYPFAWLAAIAMRGHVLWIGYFVSVLQCPVYAVLLGRAWIRNRLGQAALLILGSHLLADAVCKGFQWIGERDAFRQAGALVLDESFGVYRVKIYRND